MPGDVPVGPTGHSYRQHARLGCTEEADIREENMKPKFRQWICPEEGEPFFHYWGYIKDGRDGIVFVGPIDSTPNDPRPSEQFTGKLDKDGKEVYGDICNIHENPELLKP